MYDPKTTDRPIYIGFHIIAIARNTSLLEELGSRGMSAVQLDVTDAASIAACWDQVEKLVDSKLDLLVNNVMLKRIRFRQISYTREVCMGTEGY